MKTHIVDTHIIRRALSMAVRVSNEYHNNHEIMKIYVDNPHPHPLLICSYVILTLKVLNRLQQTTFDLFLFIYLFIFHYFSEKIRLGISCESSA